MAEVVLEDFGEEQNEATPIYCDNTLAISMTRNHVFHQRSKHIDKRYHHIKEALQLNIINLIYCNSEEQLVDISRRHFQRTNFTWSNDCLESNL